MSEVSGIADLVVARACQHGQDEHNIYLTNEQVRAMARPLDEPDGFGR